MKLSFSGLFNKKKIEEELPTIPTTDFIALDDRLSAMVISWCRKEVGVGIKDKSKLLEVSVFNLKLVYDGGAHGTEMREFIMKNQVMEGLSDYLFSRVQDLYISINMSFPKYFIETLRRKHTMTLNELGYTVDEHVSESFRFGWLLHRIQHDLRYSVTAVK